MIRNGGQLEGVMILEPGTIAAMTTNKIGEPSGGRGLGKWGNAANDAQKSGAFRNHAFLSGCNGSERRRPEW